MHAFSLAALIAADPPASTYAGIITAAATLVTAMGGLLLAWGQFQTKRQVKEVHTIVNQQRTDAQNYQRALIGALEANGISIPVDQSAPPLPKAGP
jgi:hypothetical protein